MRKTPPIPSGLIIDVANAVSRAEERVRNKMPTNVKSGSGLPREDRTTARLGEAMEHELSQITTEEGYRVAFRSEDVTDRSEDSAEATTGADVVFVVRVLDEKDRVMLEKWSLLQAKNDGGGDNPSVTKADNDQLSIDTIFGMDGNVSKERTFIGETAEVNFGRSAMKNILHSTKKMLKLTDESFVMVYDEALYPLISASEIEAARSDLPSLETGERKTWSYSGSSLASLLADMLKCKKGDIDVRQLKKVVSLLRVLDEDSSVSVWEILFEKTASEGIQLGAEMQFLQEDEGTMTAGG